MVTFMTPGSILSQLTNFFFLASGLFNDLLIIRLCLTLAYGFLLVSGVLGLPGWGEGASSGWWTGRMAVDIVVWSAVNLVFVHGSGLLRLYWDERHIDLETPEQEMLWRFFYRHSGLSKAQFRALLLPHLQLHQFAQGDVISCSQQLYILLDGLVVCDIVHRNHPSKTHKIRLASGDMFPLLHIYRNCVSRKAIFHRSNVKNPRVESPDGARAFSIPTTALETMQGHPDARTAWTVILIASLAEIAERQYAHDANTVHANNTNDHDGVLDGSLTAQRLSACVDEWTSSSPEEPHYKYHRLFQPLAPSEEPDPLLAGSGGGLSRPLGHAWRYMVLSVYLPWPWGTWPVGLRHALQPPTDPAQEATEPPPQEA